MCITGYPMQVTEHTSMMIPDVVYPSKNLCTPNAPSNIPHNPAASFLLAASAIRGSTGIGGGGIGGICAGPDAPEFIAPPPGTPVPGLFGSTLKAFSHHENETAALKTQYTPNPNSRRPANRPAPTPVSPAFFLVSPLLFCSTTSHPLLHRVPPVALQDIDPYPWFLNKNLDLVVSERLVHTRTSGSQWTDHWRPFLTRLRELWLAQSPKRFILAIAGPPGAGKSLLAEQLHWIIDRGFLHRDAHSIALPMDGFHYSNAYLQSHHRTLPDGSKLSLASVKGEPDTIDLARFRSYVHSLMARPEYLYWPAYSRYTHDVIPDKFHIHSSINLVILEGTYLLVNRGHFVGLPQLFDLRLYVDAPAPKIVANLVERHIAGGKTIDQAKDWVKRIDLPNARIAEASKPVADVVLERDTGNDIAAVHWIIPRPDEPPVGAALPVLPVPVSLGDQTLPLHAAPAAAAPPISLPAVAAAADPALPPAADFPTAH